MSASSKPTAMAVRSSNASSPISDGRTSSSKCSPSSDGSSPARLMIPPTPNSAKPLPGGRSSSCGPSSISWAFGASSINTSGKPKASRSPTAPSCSSPTGSSPRPVSTGSPAGSRPTSSATARARASCLAGLETAFVCDRKGQRFIPHWHQRRRVRIHPRQLDAWYRTLDQLHAAKAQIEVALYHRLRDLFSLKPDLVLYDITSTYFEGAGPHDFAKHGYSRDGKSQNVQVIIGMVMVAGWPIAHHVWAGNRIDHSTVQEVISDLRKRFEFGRLVFVGDRGVTDENSESITKDKHAFLVGIKRRRNAQLDAWVDAV